MSPRKRDASFLDWHYKMPTEEEMRDKYECMTDDEWAYFYQAEKESATIPSSKKKDIDYMLDTVKKAACESCTPFFQIYSRGKGTCHPVEGAITPLDLEEWGDDDVTE